MLTIVDAMFMVARDVDTSRIRHLALTSVSTRHFRVYRRH
jgi:hypothetical protein